MEYEKCELHEHVLLRPDTYVGSIEPTTRMEYIYANERIERKEITYTPALLRLFMEVLANATDNVVRSREFNIPCRSIEVSIDRETGETSVKNDGMPIPVEYFKDTSTYVPEVLFGQLLTSSNYNDSKSRTTSGRNGVGVSLTNILSKRFEVRIVDANSKKSYTQKWSDNMKTVGKPSIRSSSQKSSTTVSWIPDFDYFRVYGGYNDDTIALVKRFCIDAAMTCSIPVVFNGEKFQVKDLKSYVAKYYTSQCIVLNGPTSTCVVAPSDSFQHVSFVNGLYTRDGGVHVDAWAESVLKQLSQELQRKKILVNVKDLKHYFSFFVVSTLENPRFQSQSKDVLSFPKPTIRVETKSVSAMLRWPFVEELRKLAETKSLSMLKKTERHRGYKRIEGLDPANKAGTKYGHKCTLILCEGKSAKSYAVAGISQGAMFNDEHLKGRDWFGILELRGKFLNTRNSAVNTISSNKEMTAIVQSLGLAYSTDYTLPENRRKLNYGRVMILCDADSDGLHIQGLLLNMFDHLFPSLLKLEGFLVCMKTPIIKITERGVERRFYDKQEAQNYITQSHNAKVKYYKGLGTANNKDITETFGKKIVKFNNDPDAHNTIVRVFHKKEVPFRKDWLASYAYVEPSVKDDISISDFLNHEMIQFSLEDCRRSLPHVMDGLKESQRKILYACFLKNLKEPLKVAQLAGFIAEKTNYHHGEACLAETIVKMNQSFVGSNNLPLLLQDGQHGTRLSGGKDSASPRYIFTSLCRYTRDIFRKEDDKLLSMIEEDGEQIEPEYYVPIIPMLLVNGCDGIATAWSTDIPCFQPLALVQWIRLWLSNKETPQLIPYYNGFTGTIERNADKYITRGSFEMLKENRVRITELPVGVWTDTYKEFLEELVEKKSIRDLVNYSTCERVHFELTLVPPFTVDKLKLTLSISTSNLVAYNSNNKITRYDSIESILTEFCHTRLDYYTKRRQYVMSLLEQQIPIVADTIRFLRYVSEGVIVLYNIPEQALIDRLEQLGIAKQNGTYNYLLQLSVKSFSEQRISALQSQLETLRGDLESMRNKNAVSLWRADLDTLVEHLQ